MEIPENTKSVTKRVDVLPYLDMLVNTDQLWIGLSIGVALFVYVSYLVTHPYPAYGAGMYMQIVKQIQTNAFQPPLRIHHYSANGVPFAYPPLMFYVAAVVRSLGNIGPIAYARYVPGLVIIATVIPYYYLAKGFLHTSSKAGVATVVLATAPPVLTWHLSAGGIVRAPAFLLTVVGLFGGMRLFGAGDRRWLIPCAVLFGLTILSHPTYIVFFGVSYLLMFVFYDHSIRGLVDGAAIALGGVILAAPWWGWVIATHGISTIEAAAGTHSGLFGGVWRLYSLFVQPVIALNSISIFYIAAFLGAIYALNRRHFFLPTWMIVAGYLTDESRFIFVAGSMLISLLVLNGVRSRVINLSYSRQKLIVIAVVGLAIVSVLSVGALFGASDIHSPAGSQTQPAFIDNKDTQAMGWVKENTDSSASFVVVGDTGEWFPYFTGRPLLDSLWGAEWLGHKQYNRQISLFESISQCDSSRCLTTTLNQANVHPQYVYLPKGKYTVRGQQVKTSPQMRSSMLASSKYKLAYENDEVMIFRVTGN